MKRIVSFFFLSLIPGLTVASKFYYPEVIFENLTPYESTVFYGERKVITIKMTHKLLKYYQQWYLPLGVELSPLGGLCPAFTNGPINFPFIGDCLFNLVIFGYKLGQIITGTDIYHLYGDHPYFAPWDYLLTVPFAMKVIPHPLSLGNIPVFNATANIPFFADLKQYVNFYWENAQAGDLPHGEIVPFAQDGLYFDPIQFALVGTPGRTGIYLFNMVAANTSSRTAPTNLMINVGMNPNDKPIFKSNYLIASATPGQPYQLNLSGLLEAKGYYQGEPVRFRIDLNESHPDWLGIGGISNQYLIGVPPQYEAGDEKEVTLIASTNTGGDSKPLRLRIPIAIDPNSKPAITPFSLKKIVGNEFVYDVKKHVVDPANDPLLRLIIDQVAPAAPWLQVSPQNFTLLTGFVPEHVKGQDYQLSLHVNTRMGGDSNTIKVPLSIAIDEEKKPRFKAANPQLPMLYPGQSFYHDFVVNRDIFPDYEDIPYFIEFAQNSNNPSWLRVENNKLLADLVPQLSEQTLKIYLTIKNTPGGRSEVIPLSLFVMN